MRPWLGLMLAAAIAAPAAASENVLIQSGDLALKTVVFRPDGDGPFPALVALHGCSGLGDRNNPVRVNYRDWAERLTAAGYAVVLPDSFASRNAGPQCQVRDGRIRPIQRVADANAARRWLQEQPWAKGDRVSLVGWSQGASTVLWTVRRRASLPRKEIDFRSAVAFYPNCRRSNDTAWSARVPTLILIGQADDWASARACETMVAGARGRSARIDLVTYPDAHHGFDHPNLPLRERTGLAVTASNSGRAHVGSNPSARADAIRRVSEWLAR